MNNELFELHARLEQSHWWFVSRRTIVTRLLRKVLAETGCPLVVDVGCGTGGNIGELGDWCRVMGIDASPRAIELARRRFPAIRYVQGVAPDDLGETARLADAFLIMDVLEHAEHDGALLARIVRSARPGAYLVLTVPADMSLWSEHDVSFGHVRRYTVSQLRARWGQLPVEEVLVSNFNSRLYPLVCVARTLSRTFRFHWGRHRSDLGELPGWLNGALRVVFSGEWGRLERVLERRSLPYGRGVSIIGVLRRSTTEWR